MYPVLQGKFVLSIGIKPFTYVYNTYPLVFRCAVAMVWKNVSNLRNPLLLWLNSEPNVVLQPFKYVLLHINYVLRGTIFPSSGIYPERQFRHRQPGVQSDTCGQRQRRLQATGCRNRERGWKIVSLYK